MLLSTVFAHRLWPGAFIIDEHWYALQTSKSQHHILQRTLEINVICLSIDLRHSCEWIIEFAFHSNHFFFFSPWGKPSPQTMRNKHVLSPTPLYSLSHSSGENGDESEESIWEHERQFSETGICQSDDIFTSSLKKRGMFAISSFYFYLNADQPSGNWLQSVIHWCCFCWLANFISETNLVVFSLIDVIVKWCNFWERSPLFGISSEDLSEKEYCRHLDVKK